MTGKKKGGSSSLSHARQALAEAEQQCAAKEAEVRDLREMMDKTRCYVTDLENDAQANRNLDQMVQELLANQQQAAAAYSDYENRVLVLELQGMVDRYRMMDVENLAEQNHELREEIFRLQHENMELSRAMAEGSQRSRKDLAKIELALEITAREKLREAQEHIRRDVISNMDEKTLRMLEDHDSLKDRMHALSNAASQLESRLATISAERVQFRNNAEAGEEMTEMQSKQVLLLRQQLDMAFQMNNNLEMRLNEAEAQLERATTQAIRDTSSAIRRSHRAGDGEEDSAFGRSGEEVELAELQRQLRQLRHRFDVTRLQRDNWRDRSMLYEKACAQLQASLQTLQDQAHLTLPSGAKQSLDSIWAKAKGMSSPERSTRADARLAVAQAQSRQIQSARAASSAARPSSAWNPPRGKPVGRILSANPGMGRRSAQPSTTPLLASKRLQSANQSGVCSTECSRAQLVVYEEGEEEGEEETVDYVDVEGTGEEIDENPEETVLPPSTNSSPLWQVARPVQLLEQQQPQQHQEAYHQQSEHQSHHHHHHHHQQQQQPAELRCGEAQHSPALSAAARPLLDVNLIAEILGRHGYTGDAPVDGAATVASTSGTPPEGRTASRMDPGWDPAPPPLAPQTELGKQKKKKEIPLGEGNAPSPPDPVSLTALPMSRLYTHDEAGFMDHMSSSLGGNSRPQSAAVSRQYGGSTRSSLRYTSTPGAPKRQVSAHSPSHAAYMSALHEQHQQQDAPRRLYSASASLQQSSSRSRSSSVPSHHHEGLSHPWGPRLGLPCGLPSSRKKPHGVIT